MHIFSFNENQKPYVYPILKIVISVALTVIVFFVRFHFLIENDIVNVVTGVASVAVFVAGLQCIFRSVAEIEDIRENRTIQVKANEKVKAKYKAVPVDKIVSLVKNNDIIAIKIVSGEKVVEIGASADCKRGIGHSPNWDRHRDPTATLPFPRRGKQHDAKAYRPYCN